MAEQKEKKRRPGRFRYMDHYETVTRVCPDGKTVQDITYIGGWALPEHPEAVYRQMKRLAAIPAGITIAATALLLAFRSFSVYKGGLYTLVPVTMALVPEMYAVIGTLKLPKEDARLQLDVLQLAHGRIKKSFIGILVLFILAIVFSVIFFAVSEVPLKRIDALYCLLMIIPPVMAGILLGVMRKLKYREEK